MLYFIESKIKANVNLGCWDRLYHSAEIVCKAKQLAWSLERKKEGKDTFWPGQIKEYLLYISFVFLA